jgi:hypothetical protein
MLIQRPTRPSKSHGWAACAAGLLLGLACAAKAPPESRPPSRVKDSAPERAAALRAASGNLNLEAEDSRWGIEAARARDADAQKKATTAVIPMPSPTGRTPPDAGAPDAGGRHP